MKVRTGGITNETAIRRTMLRFESDYRPIFGSASLSGAISSHKFIPLEMGRDCLNRDIHTIERICTCVHRRANPTVSFN